MTPSNLPGARARGDVVNDLLTVDEAAPALRMTGRHLYRLIKDGRSPVRVIPVGSTMRILRSDLDRFLAGDTTGQYGNPVAS